MLLGHTIMKTAPEGIGSLTMDLSRAAAFDLFIVSNTCFPHERGLCFYAGILPEPLECLRPENPGNKLCPQFVSRLGVLR